MSDYAPTLEEIRAEWSWATFHDPRAGEEAFDRWLAAHDAALIENLADEIRHKQHAESIRQMLREKARQRREGQQ